VPPHKGLHLLAQENRDPKQWRDKVELSSNATINPAKKPETIEEAPETIEEAQAQFRKICGRRCKSSNVQSRRNGRERNVHVDDGGAGPGSDDARYGANCEARARRTPAVAVILCAKR
jgi:hypothetical protein